MNIFSIESSCDDTSIAIVQDGRHVISLKTFSQVKRHAVFGGVVPEVASRCHLESISLLAKLVFEDSKLKKEDIDAVAVTYCPGLIGSLLVGLNFAKGMSMALDVPLIPVHHLKAHVASNYISNNTLEPPFICLVVSGGHTSIVEVKDYNLMKTIGKTRDDAAGETFDKVARCLGMPYPGGVYLDKAAKIGDPDSFEFPIPKIKDKKYDFSFSGLKTAAINKINTLKQKNEEIKINDIAASMRKAVVNYLTSNLVSATLDFNYKKVAIAGGVSANSLLRENLSRECRKRGWEFFMPSLDLSGDNAAMVGAQGYYEFKCGNIAQLDLNAYASMPM